MKNFILILISFLLLTSIVNSSFPANGVYVSGDSDYTYTPKDANDARIVGYIEDYVQKVVVNEVLTATGKLMQRIIEQQNFKIFPQLAYNATQQATLQVFKQDATKKITQDAYNQSLDKALMLHEDGASQAEMQNEIKKVVERIINLLKREHVYERIIEEVIKKSVNETQRILVMQVAQQKARLMAIQQAEYQMKRAIAEQYQKAVQSAVIARVNNINKLMVEQITEQDKLFRNYQRQLQQQYNKARSLNR